MTQNTTLKLLILTLSISFLTAQDIYCTGKWDMIATGGQATLALLSNGTLYSWGWNMFGHLGIGWNIPKATRYMRVDGFETYKFVAIKGTSTYAIKTNGKLFAWGSNLNGELGINDTNLRVTPVQVGNESDWLTVAPGSDHALGLKKNGTLYAWGNNFFGQLGHGILNNTLLPVKIWPNTTWKNCFAGEYSSFAIKEDGALFGWGSNRIGQLGDNTTEDKFFPVRAGGENKKYSMVSSSPSHTLAIDTEGNLFSWGANDKGQLGIGTFDVMELTPVVPLNTNNSKWKTVSAGPYYSMAIREDGSLWSFGENVYGQLGNGQAGRALNISTPTQIGKEFTWKNISAGVSYVFGVTNDSMIIGWGSNVNGELGDGTSKARYLPQRCVASGSEEKPSQSGKTWIIILIVSGGILVVIAVVCAVYLIRRKAAKKEALLAPEDRVNLDNENPIEDKTVGTQEIITV